MLLGVVEAIRRLHELAARQHYLVSRDQVLGFGLGDSFIEHQLSAGRWLRIHDGVYQVDFRSLDRPGDLMAAVLACGPGALVSHRAAFVLWDLDGIDSAPIEITVPFNNRPVPDGVIVHRTRRPTIADTRQGVPVVSVERTLLDCAGCLPRRLVAKALDSALRRSVTTVDRVWLNLIEDGGRGVRGTRALRWVLRERHHDTSTDSGAEFDLLFQMQLDMLPRPELKHAFVTGDRRIVPDFYWPQFHKAVEVDGLDAHASADKLDDDLVRQNLLLDLGVELRRFSARRVRREPGSVVAEIREFLGA